MDPIQKERNVKLDYKFSDLLAYYPDGAGNAQCFYRGDGNENETVDWDHETWEISRSSEEEGFFEFIDESLIYELEDE
jgi:hypothetical protein